MQSAVRLHPWVSQMGNFCKIISHRTSKLQLFQPKRYYVTEPAPTGGLGSIIARLRDGSINNVVVMTGAGISTPSGIPDFRSPDTGLYSTLEEKFPMLPYPEAIFDIGFFQQHPQPFFAFAKELYPSGKYAPNVLHYFARLLSEKGRLLRVYTQNIDGLERLSGIPADKLIEAHGGFATATCRHCGALYPGSAIKPKIMAGEIPYCKETKCKGVIKPDIVFFGENLPDRFHVCNEDLPRADLLLIMGTSLEVYPFAGIADLAPYNIPRVLFNREVAGPFIRKARDEDYAVEGDLVNNITQFCTALGWLDDLTMLQKTHEKELTYQRSNC